MLMQLRLRLSSLSRVLATGFLGLWLAAALTPCATAAAAACPEHDGATDTAAMSSCAGMQTMLDCTPSDAGLLTADVLPDMTPVPVLLALLPADTVTATAPAHLIQAGVAPPGPLPLYLAHLVLLI